MDGGNCPRNELRFASVRFRGDKAARFSRPPLSILGGSGRSALRRSERLTLQQLERLLELEVLVRGELERSRRLVLALGRRLGAGALRLVGPAVLFLLVDEVLFQIRLAQPPRGRRSGILDHDIGDDALRLDRAAARRVVTGGGQLDRGVVAQGQYRLHRALAESRRAQQRRALVVLQRARDDFGGGGRAAVDEHDHRHGLDRRGQVLEVIVAVAPQVVFRGGDEFALGVLGAAVGRYHQHPRRQERGGDAHRAVQEPARIVAQVENKALQRSVLIETLQVLHQVLAGVLLKLGNAYPPVAGLDQLGFHALHADDVARERHLEGIRLALAQDGEPDGGARLAAHALDRFVQVHALDRGVVDLDDEVPGLQARAERRSVLDRRNHLDETLFHADLDAQAAEFALGADLKLAERVLVQIRRVRIEPGEHAADRFGDELLVLDRLDVARLDRAEHFGKGAQLIDRQREARRLALGYGGKIKDEQK